MENLEFYPPFLIDFLITQTKTIKYYTVTLRPESHKPIRDLLQTYPASSSPSPSTSVPVVSAGLKQTINQNLQTSCQPSLLQVLISNDHHHDAHDEVHEGKPGNRRMTTLPSSSPSSYPVSDLAEFSLNSSVFILSMVE